eukprot:jgi/Ulvmu1/6031/UM027_0006.1
MAVLCFWAAALVLARAGSVQASLPTDAWIIAHRGASGAVPEHTLEAYQLAVDQGADFIECDVVVTKDRKLICRHEPLLSGTTDADAKFPDRMTAYTIDGDLYEGVFSTDLTLAEIKTLRAVQPNEQRDPQYGGMFSVPTFEEYMEVALAAGRVVGIYPETKHPAWHNGLDIMAGTSMEDLLLASLSARGYSGGIASASWAAQPCFIQSFEVGNLKYLSSRTELPLVQLLGGWEGYVTPDTGATHADMTTDAALHDIASYAAGVGPWKDTLLPTGDDGYIGPSTGLVQRIQANGMQVHPYTFRNEDSYLAWTWAQDPYPEMYAFVEREGINGFFTDFPASAVAFRSRLALGEPETLDIPTEPGVSGDGGMPGSFGVPGSYGEDKAPLPADRPFIVAHRGASGVLPEHTVEAYQLAIEQGADFIECDVVVTKDLKLICRHEPLLSGTTDADAKFPDRITAYTIDGDLYEGVFSTDLTLAEIKTLRAVQPREGRDPNYDGQFTIPTFEEYMDVALAAGRVVGIYPETKHPTWHNGLATMADTSMEDLLLASLSARGYSGGVASASWAAQPCFIQSFEVGNLKYLSSRTELPLVQLLGGWEGYVTPDTGATHADMTTDAALRDIASYAAGVGPWKNTLVPVSDDRLLEEPTRLVARLHALGLQVHPYTFRNEADQLAYDFVASARAEYDLFLKEIGVDGCFTDFAGTLFDWVTEQKLEGTAFDKMLTR